MSDPRPTVVLVHGANADSASWNGVITRLADAGYTVVAQANPMRALESDAEYLAATVRNVEGPVLLVGHSYGGAVISQAAPQAPNVSGLVFVAGIAPEAGETTVGLVGKYPGSTLGETLIPYPLGDGVVDVYLDPAKYHQQFVGGAPDDVAFLMAVTQRPATDGALNEAAAGPQGWQTLPSWFVFGDEDKNIPVALHRFMAERAHAHRAAEVPGAPHALGVTHPQVVTDIILEALTALS
jgi:pimeloyl-ACP methyl ester carboxylesterase